MKQDNLNSIYNYHNIVAPHLTEARQIVYNAIRELGRSVMDVEIADHLKIPINRVSGRVGDLEKLGLIVCDDSNRNEAGNRCRKSHINFNYGLERSNLRPEVKERIMMAQTQPHLL